MKIMDLHFFYMYFWQNENTDVDIYSIIQDIQEQLQWKHILYWCQLCEGWKWIYIVYVDQLYIKS